jgi:type IV secretory pathway ATPase VirB11/archaellum biosynthesis ATPase
VQDTRLTEQDDVIKLLFLKNFSIIGRCGSSAALGYNARPVSPLVSMLDAEQRLRNLPQPTYPDDLPVVARRADIARAIGANQVVIICGETGSGKTRSCRKSAWSCGVASKD